MEVRSWVEDKFGTTDQTLLSTEVYPEDDLRRDKIKLERQHNRIENEIEEHRNQYKQLVTRAAGEDDIRKQTLAKKAKNHKKQYQLKQKKYQKTSMKYGTVLSIEGARELLHEEQTSKDPDLAIDDVMDHDLHVEKFETKMEEKTVDFDMEVDLVKRIQESLDFNFTSSDMSMGSDDDVMKDIEEAEKGQLDEVEIDIEDDSADVSASVEASVDVEDDSSQTEQNQTTADNKKREGSSDLAEAKSHSTEIKTTVVGVGGAGSLVIDKMSDGRVDDVRLIAADTSVNDLVTIEADTKILMGQQKTQGRGTGSLPQVGEEAATESQGEIYNALKDADIVFVTAGLGGGTGTGSAPIVAKAAQDANALTIALVTTPNTAEGEVRRTNAILGIQRLQDVSDIVVTYPNERLLDEIKDQSPHEAFRFADDTLLPRIINTFHQFVGNLDDGQNQRQALHQLLKHQGIAVGTSGSGGRMDEAVENALESALVKEPDLLDTESVAIAGSSSRDISEDEIKDVKKSLRSRLGSNIPISIETSTVTKLRNEVRAFVFLCGLEPTRLVDPSSSEMDEKEGNNGISQMLNGHERSKKQPIVNHNVYLYDIPGEKVESSRLGVPLQISENAIQKIKNRLREGDIVLVRGAHLDRLDEELEELQSFTTTADGDILLIGGSVIVMTPEGTGISRQTLDDEINVKKTEQPQVFIGRRSADWQNIVDAVQFGNIVLVQDSDVVDDLDTRKSRQEYKIVEGFNDDLPYLVLPDTVTITTND